MFSRQAQAIAVGRTTGVADCYATAHADSILRPGIALRQLSQGKLISFRVGERTTSASPTGAS